ncbi:MAG: hypothetical protein ACOC80_05375 [Petrotogales bacterium]
MKRLIFLILFSLLCVTMYSTDFTGLLSEKIPWNAGNELTVARIGKEKPEYLSIKHSENFRYGKINIGNNPIDFVLVQGEEPMIWVDSNNNDSLMDNELIAPSSKDTLNNVFIFGWKIRVTTFYENLEFSESRLVKIVARREVTQENFEVRYCLYEHREGLAIFGNEVMRKVKVFTTNPEGFYKLEDIYFGVDTDDDDQISLITDSYELFYSCDDAFRISDKTYKLKEISEDGRKVCFAETNERPVEKPRFVKGESFPFPDSFNNLIEEIDRTDLSGNVFIVVLSKATPEQIKGTQLNENSGFDSLNAFNRFRLDEIIKLSEKCTNLKILWIVTSGNIDNYKEYSNIYLTDNSSLVKYYGMQGEERVYIVDEEGTLVQFDEYWVDEETLETENPQSGKLMLGTKDIRTVVLDLIFN